MIIANPIYDIVFKYLMEDIAIAKGLLSVILNVEVTELSLRPQEWSTKTVLVDLPLNIYRLDFIAVIKSTNGAYQKVLIELQKTKRSTNIVRFRKYLGENYDKQDAVIINGKEVLQPLEIITIYFLGFDLDDVPASVTKVKNCFIDVTTGERLKREPTNKFIRLLNHESYIVQIRKLHPNLQSRVENVLDIFSQRYKTDNEHKLDYKNNSNDPLIGLIVNRLIRAVADDNMRRNMDIEDEINADLQDIDDKYSDRLEEKDQIIEEKDQIIEQKNQELEQTKQDKLKLEEQIEILKRQLSK